MGPGIGSVGLINHFGRTVDSGHSDAGFGHLGRQLSRAATQVENRLTGDRLQQFQERRSQFPDEGVLGVVQIRVPSRACFAHFFTQASSFHFLYSESTQGLSPPAATSFS